MSGPPSNSVQQSKKKSSDHFAKLLLFQSASFFLKSNFSFCFFQFATGSTPDYSLPSLFILVATCSTKFFNFAKCVPSERHLKKGNRFCGKARKMNCHFFFLCVRVASLKPFQVINLMSSRVCWNHLLLGMAWKCRKGQQISLEMICEDFVFILIHILFHFTTLEGRRGEAIKYLKNEKLLDIAEWSES